MAADLHAFKEKWEKKYPIVAKSSLNNWINLCTYFEYDGQVRKTIYTLIQLKVCTVRSIKSQSPKVHLVLSKLI